MTNAPKLEPGTPLPEYSVVAHNSATESENKIHDDSVARQYGFAGGLVPGVTVFAYMVPPVIRALGNDWLSAGRMGARFLKPVYEGEETRVTAIPREVDGAIELELEAKNPAGEVCATGTAGMLGRDVAIPAATAFATADLPEDREPVSEEALRRRENMGVVHATADREAIDKFLVDTRDDDPRWKGDDAPVHPGFLIRWANTILASNVRLNPWIHVSSEAVLANELRVGEEFETRGRVVELFERKGHRFVRLDVLIIGADERPIMHVDHTAIYDIRKVEDA